jgi:predicted nucleic acid-binding protein
LNEFFAIITDPRRVRNPRDHEEALAEVEKYFRSKHILKIQAGPEIFEKMLELLKKYKIKGAKIFDLQLVATMLSSNITCLYTYNKEDFLCFEGIRVLIP